MDEKTQITVNDETEAQIQDVQHQVSKDSDVALELVDEMIKAGLIYGHKKSKTNPKFKPYIYITRSGVEIIDVTQTLPAIASAVEFLSGILKNKGSVLIVATQPAAKEATINLAKKFNFSYINDRWVGGLMTNFRVISKRIGYFKKTQEDMAKGEFEKYTKKERVMINRKIEKMKKMFSGLEDLTKLPDLLFIVDFSIKGHNTALREAMRLNIPVMAIIDSDDNPDFADYPIPANDHAKISIDWIVKRIADNLESSKFSELNTN